jgi:hypothetical protein
MERRERNGCTTQNVFVEAEKIFSSCSNKLVLLLPFLFDEDSILEITIIIITNSSHFECSWDVRVTNERVPSNLTTR